MTHALPLCLLLLPLVGCGAPPPEAPAAVDAPETLEVSPVPVPAPVEEKQIGGEWVGEVVGAPATVALEHSAGDFAIDAFEASLHGDKAASVPGVAPAAGLSWFEAHDACASASKRLCSEEEWMLACSGAPPVDRDHDGVFSDDPVVGRKYPYGPAFQDGYCASSRDRNDPRPLVTGNHPRCATPEGVYDLEGLTKEWIGVTPDRAAVKGGSYFSKGSARCGYYKDSVALDTRDPSIGFRCCTGPVPPSGEPEGLQGSRLGDEVADWALTTLDGKTLSMADLEGKPVVLTFWASWCGPCRQELPALAEEYGIYASEGLRIIAVNVDTDVNKAKAFLKTTPIPFTIVLDPKNTLRAALDAQTLPTAVFIGPDGRIRQRTIGYDSTFRGELANNVSALMAAKPLE